MPIKLKRLAEQVIVVTGATSGNGLAIVEMGVRAGARVVAVARNADALAELRGRLSPDGAQVATCVADVSDMAAVERVADAALGGVWWLRQLGQQRRDRHLRHIGASAG